MGNVAYLFLKSKRKALGMSVKEVVDKLSEREIVVSDKTIYSWESGHRQPDADTFLALCDIYGVSNLNDELQEVRNTPKPVATSSGAKEEEIYQMLKKLVSDLHIDLSALTDRQKLALEIISNIIADNF